MRAALLPTPGDPFLCGFWIRNFERVWRDEVDELHVLINGQTDPDVLRHLEIAFAQAKPGAVSIIESQAAMEHGQALRLLAEATAADTLVLCEDDAYPRRPGAIAEQLAVIEAGDTDVIGSPRGCASQELIEAAWRRWPDVAKTESLDEGHGLWPAFMFLRTETMLDTDRHYAARIWQQGELVDGLDHQAAAQVSADTMVSASWQLRAKYRISHVPQYRIADPDFVREWFAHEPGWFHVGSLSSGYGTAFAARDDHTPADLTNDMTGATEWARRIYWWDRFVSHESDALPEQRAAYRAGLDELIEKTGTRDVLQRWTHLFEGWVTWE